WSAPTSSALARPARELVFDGRQLDAARGKEHVQVVDEVGRLLDDPLVGLGERGPDELDRLLPHLLRTRADSVVEQLRGVRAVGPFGGAFGDDAPQAG